MKLPARFLVHTVTVAPYTGRSSVGDVYGPTFTLRCFRDGTRRLVRDADGAERPSTLTLLCELGSSEVIPVGSRIGWGGTSTVVMGATEHDDAGMGSPQHCEVVCE